jgi:hypothetical protein
MKFKALIDGVHFDAKKGSVKIVLVGASHVSLDELTTLSPKDDSITLDEDAVAKLEEAADRLREGDVDGA